MENNKSVLILVPAITARGGIANYYHVLKNHFSSIIEYFERGARTWPIRKGVIQELIRAWKDYVKFKKRLAKGDIKLVQTSTSISLNTTIRDGLFLRHARKKGLKTIVFFRGWDNVQEKKIESYFLNIFKYFFFKCDLIIVLSTNVKEKIEKWGYTGQIKLETTLVDKELIQDYTLFDIDDKFQKFDDTNQINLLYLSRVEKRKGIYELIEAVKNLKDVKQKISLSICGDGFELKNIERKISEEKLKNITLKGFVSGIDKKNEFEKAHLFIFPSYEEGMPNAVLEAMGFGLPIITTPVGGLKDFFKNNEHGLFIKPNDPNDIHIKIKTFIKNKELVVKISRTNYSFARETFQSDIVAKRIENIFKEVLKS